MTYVSTTVTIDISRVPLDLLPEGVTGSPQVYSSRLVDIMVLATDWLVAIMAMGC